MQDPIKLFLDKISQECSDLCSTNYPSLFRKSGKEDLKVGEFVDESKTSMINLF